MFIVMAQFCLYLIQVFSFQLICLTSILCLCEKLKNIILSPIKGKNKNEIYIIFGCQWMLFLEENSKMYFCFLLVNKDFQANCCCNKCYLSSFTFQQVHHQKLVHFGLQYLPGLPVCGYYYSYCIYSRLLDCFFDLSYFLVPLKNKHIYLVVKGRVKPLINISQLINGCILFVE